MCSLLPLLSVGVVGVLLSLLPLGERQHGTNESDSVRLSDFGLAQQAVVHVGNSEV